MTRHYSRSVISGLAIGALAGLAFGGCDGGTATPDSAQQRAGSDPIEAAQQATSAPTVESLVSELPAATLPSARPVAAQEPTEVLTPWSGDTDALASAEACPNFSNEDGLDCTILVCANGATINRPKPGWCVVSGVCVAETDAGAPVGCGDPNLPLCPDPALADALPCTMLVCDNFVSQNVLVPGRCIEGGKCWAAGELGAPAGCGAATCPDTAIEDGLACTDLVCVNGATYNQPKPGFCAAHGTCYSAGDQAPGDSCGFCAPSTSQTKMTTVLWEDQFDDGDSAGWTLEDVSGAGVKWQVDAQRASTPGHSLYFGKPANRNYVGTGNLAVQGRATTPWITVDPGVITRLEFKLFMDTTAPSPGALPKDNLFVSMERASGGEIALWDSISMDSTSEGNFYQVRMDIPGSGGDDVRFKFYFDTQDNGQNQREGAYVDEVRLKTICCSEDAHCDDGQACTQDACAGGECFYDPDPFDPTCINCKPEVANIVMVVDRGGSGSSGNALSDGQYMEMVNGIFDTMGKFDAVMNVAVKMYPTPGAGIGGGCFVDLGADVDFDADMNTAVAALVAAGTSSSKPVDRGLRAAIKIFENAGITENKVVLLLSRGQYNCNAEPLKAVQDLAAKGIKTYVVVLNNNEDVALHNEMAAIGGAPKVPLYPGDVFYYRSDSLHQLKYSLFEAFGRASSDLCDEVDSNCNLIVDEDHSDRDLCIKWCGEWRQGYTNCVDGKPSECIIPINEEICNGKDDDCDGLTDEDLVSQCVPLGTPAGCPPCYGEMICDQGGQWGSWVQETDPITFVTKTVWKPGLCLRQDVADDQCDGIDNNCNCVVDDLFPLGQACDSTDSDMCKNGTWECGFPGPQCTQDSDCPPPIDPGGYVHCAFSDGLCHYTACPNENPKDIPEVCDGVNDEDCDGTVDEEDALGCDDYWYDGDRDTWGAGTPRCLCAPEDFWDSDKDGDCDDTDATIYPGAPEICDGKDNDCDGYTDEDPTNPFLPMSDVCYTGPPATLDVGVCHAGTATCIDGKWGTCIDEVVPSDEICDGLDGDCDGVEDPDEHATGDNPCETDPVCLFGDCYCMENAQTNVWSCVLE